MNFLNMSAKTIRARKASMPSVQAPFTGVDRTREAFNVQVVLSVNSLQVSGEVFSILKPLAAARLITPERRIMPPLMCCKLMLFLESPRRFAFVAIVSPFHVERWQLVRI